MKSQPTNNSGQKSLSRSIEQLSEAKLRLLKSRLKTKGVGPSLTPAPSKLPKAERPVLSFSQQNLWLSEQAGGNPTLYNGAYVSEIKGPLDPKRLETSIDAAIRRHQCLRTKVDIVDDQPCPSLIEHRAFVLPIHDLSSSEREDRETEFEQLAETIAREPFDTTKGPLFRFRLFVLGAEHYRLVWVIHHLVTDGWSNQILENEIFERYRSNEPTHTDPEADPAPQYSDFAAWHRQQVESGVYERDLTFWKERLAHWPPRLNWPRDRFPEAALTFEGQRIKALVPQETADRLRQIGQRHQATLYMVLLTAFFAWLKRLTGNEDLVVSTPVAGRTHKATESMVGCFINTILLRVDIADSPSFDALLDRVRSAVVSSFDHQAPPFSEVVRAANPVRQSDGHSLVQAMFQLRNYPLSNSSSQELTITKRPLSTGISKLELSLDATETADGLLLELEFSTELFSPKGAQNCLSYFTYFLGQIAVDPTRATDLYPLAPSAKGPITSPPLEPQSTDNFVCRFEQMALTDPSKAAVFWQGSELSYSELNTSANQVAHYLTALGAGPDRAVGVFMNRSESLIVSLVAIMKAGSAFLPIDPSYPEERINYLVEDGQVALIITDSDCQSHLPETQANILCVSEHQERILEMPSTNPHHPIHSDQLAYVIYTSGSTGRPKGVMVTNGGLLNLIDAVADEYSLNSRDTVLQFASISFDIAVEEIFPTLAIGAALVLRSDEAMTSTRLLYEEVKRYDVSVLDLPTAYWHTLTQESSLEQERLPSSVRLVIVGGERVSSQCLERWTRSGGAPAEWINTYGPTETTVTATAYHIQPTDKPWEGRWEVPLGHAISGTQIHLLDSLGHPVPPGVVGEIFIGGSGVGRGYLGRPDLTADRFVPDSLSSMPGSRMYRTGDRGRMRFDGQLEFLGRVDQQVKIRGFRIELAEIETVLALSGVVDECAIVSRVNPAGETALVAYGKPRDTDQDYTAAIQDYLKTRLPHYMVPSAFVAMDAMPLTPNGKVDHKQLPEPEWHELKSDSNSIAPRTPEENQIFEIWSDVLGSEAFGVNENFFSLGGHSLSVTQVVSRVRSAFGVEVPMKRFFESPTIADLAEFIAADRSSFDDVHVLLDGLGDDREEMEF